MRNLEGYSPKRTSDLSSITHFLRIYCRITNYKLMQLFRMFLKCCIYLRYKVYIYQNLSVFDFATRTLARTAAWISYRFLVIPAFLLVRATKIKYYQCMFHITQNMYQASRTTKLTGEYKLSPASSTEPLDANLDNIKQIVFECLDMRKWLTEVQFSLGKLLSVSLSKD